MLYYLPFLRDSLRIWTQNDECSFIQGKKLANILPNELIYRQENVECFLLCLFFNFFNLPFSLSFLWVTLRFLEWNSRHQKDSCSVLFFWFKFYKIHCCNLLPRADPNLYVALFGPTMKWKNMLFSYIEYQYQICQS